MRKVIYISEVVMPYETKAGPGEVFVSADAHYDETKGELVVALSSLVRCHETGEKRWEDWLPRSETLREAMDFEEGMPATKEIFESWVKRIRSACDATRLHPSA